MYSTKTSALTRNKCHHINSSLLGGQPHKHGVASSKVIQTRACKAPGDSSRRRQLRLIGESMIRLRNQWALIRASDRKKGRSIRGWMRSDKSYRSQDVCQSIGVSKSSNKSYWSQDICWSNGESMSSDKSYDRKTFVGRSGNQRALIRATDRKTFLTDRGVNEICYRSGSQWALIRAPDHMTFVGW